ncbi:hypothetical protein [Fluviispira multicolorata]|uniref:Uncharacterized protein n=1 Tax=Fluviispira multicolorata TaxID=2654512 RepID=A0A833JER9_9BACT|nr:hypothetical protein [Fluviispira multicolorata]KAB8029989.1 hypothetical protein GCL57_10660 [Fluviispira multicolorata]
MTKNAKLTLLFSSLFLSSSAFAGGPNIVNKCAFKGINHPENSNAVMFDEECANAYVLPPEVGKVTVSAVQQNLNLGFCSTLKIDQNSVRQSALIRESIRLKINNMRKELDPLEKE